MNARLRALALLLGVAAALGAQESAPVVDRVAERANNPNPYVSAQGLRALKLHGTEAIGAIERLVARRSVHVLAPLVVEWLGEVDDDRARALLRDVLKRKDFAWRPQAAKALAREARPSEIEAFLAAVHDRLPAVREPALGALAAIALKEPATRARVIEALDAGLSDPTFEPRLAAAEALLRLGETRAAGALVEALGVERRFFDLDFGVLARRRAWAALEPLVGKGVAFEPGWGPARNALAIAEVVKRLGDRAGSRPGAPLAADAGDAILGVEVRSCRVGDQWVRVTAAGELVLGNYDLRVAKLDAASFAGVRRLVAEAVRQGSGVPFDPGAFLGRPGCDFEKWYVPDESGLLTLTVGLEGRPQSLQALHQALVDVIQGAVGAAEADAFSDRTAPFGKAQAGED